MTLVISMLKNIILKCKTISKALVILFVAMELVFFPTQGFPFPSRVVEVLILHTAHIPSSCKYNPRCLPFESRAIIIKVCFPKFPII